MMNYVTLRWNLSLIPTYRNSHREVIYEDCQDRGGLRASLRVKEFPMFENFTGVSAFGDALYIVAFQLRQAFYKGKRRVRRRDARYELMRNAPLGRLRMDGVNYY